MTRKQVRPGRVVVRSALRSMFGLPVGVVTLGSGALAQNPVPRLTNRWCLTPSNQAGRHSP